MSTCRLRLQANGLPYPKSSCGKCGSVLQLGWKCAEGFNESPAGLSIHQSHGLPSMGSGSRLAVVYDNGSLLVMAEGASMDATFFQKNATQNARVAKVEILSAVEVTDSDFERAKLQQKIKEARDTLAALERQEKDLV